MNEFHKRKKSAAVLKHAILSRYATPFATKTGKYSPDNRVAFIDGYAGPGRYDDGQEGSGAMLLQKARELAGRSAPRKLECHFVEGDRETARRLREVSAVEGQGLTYTIREGDISEHLPELLESVREIPLFAYLDPCGLIIPLDEVARIFDRPNWPGAPATEVLINLTAQLRRFGGMLTSSTPNENSLKRIDAVCGGMWWRDAWLEKCSDKNASAEDKIAAEETVVTGYAQRLRERAGGAGTWVIDVRTRAELKPIYYLVFATRHIDGLLTFGESASTGLEAWRKYQAEVAAEGTLFETGKAWEQNWKAAEADLKERWIQAIADGLKAELSKGETFQIIDRTEAVLGELVGAVRTTHLRGAINRLLKEKITLTDPKGINDLYRLPIKPA